MNPDSLAGFASRVTDADPESRREALAALQEADEAAIGDELRALFAVAADADDSDHRHRALDVAYAVVEDALSSLDALPPALFASLTADETRIRASAVVRALNCSAATIEAALDADDPARRRAAAQYLQVVAVDETPFERLEALLADPDADVRAAAARALLRAIEREQCNDHFGVSQQSRDVLPSLIEATEDEGPRVRAAAAVAAGHVVLDEEVPSDRAATAARRLGRSLGDTDERVREDVTEFVDVHRPFEERAPVLVVLWYAVGVAEATVADTATPDTGGEEVEIPDRARVGGNYLPASDDPQCESAVEELIRLGWDPESPAPTAQRLIARIPDEYHEAVAASFDRIGDGVTRGVGVEHGATTLEAIAAAHPERTGEVVETLRECLPDESAAAPALASVATTAGRVDDVIADLRRTVETDPTPAAVDGLVTATGGGGTQSDVDALWQCADEVSHDRETRLTAASGVATLLERGAGSGGKVAAAGEPFTDLNALVDLLVSFLASPEEAERTEAATALGSIGAAETEAATPESADAAGVVDAFAASFGDGGDEEPLAVLAGAAPDRARDVVATLCSALSPGDDWRTLDRLDPVEEAIEVDPSVGTAAVADLAAAAQPWGTDRGRAKALDALAAVAESEPAAVADEVTSLTGLLTHRSERIRDAAATVVASVGAERPSAVPPSLRSLAETDRDDDRWPMGVLARDAPSVAEAAVDASLSASHWDGEAAARLLAQVGRTNRDVATDGTDWMADMLWGGVNVRSTASVVEALAPRDPSLAVRCVEPLAEHVTEGTPRWERGAAIEALAAVAEHRPEPVRVAVRNAVDRSLVAFRKDIYWQFEDDVEDLFAAAGLEADGSTGSNPAEDEGAPDDRDRGTNTTESGSDGGAAAFWETVDRYRR
ncbi:HEAT repeat domain-containing protein [Halosimplex sp. J119]